MGKVSTVEINGHNYRYEYVDGATVYRGPVGNAPAMSEQEFLQEMEVDDDFFEKFQSEFEKLQTIRGIRSKKLHAIDGRISGFEKTLKSLNQDRDEILMTDSVKVSMVYGGAYSPRGPRYYDSFADARRAVVTELRTGGIPRKITDFSTWNDGEVWGFNGGFAEMSIIAKKA